LDSGLISADPCPVGCHFASLQTAETSLFLFLVIPFFFPSFPSLDMRTRASNSRASAPFPRQTTRDFSAHGAVKCAIVDSRFLSSRGTPVSSSAVLFFVSDLFFLFPPLSAGELERVDVICDGVWGGTQLNSAYYFRPFFRIAGRSRTRTSIDCHPSPPSSLFLSFSPLSRGEKRNYRHEPRLSPAPCVPKPNPLLCALSTERGE